MGSKPLTAAAQIAQRVRSSARRTREVLAQSASVCATLMFRTHRRRWTRVAHQPVPPWDDRNRAIAALIGERKSVLDLGCGAQSLKRHLHAGCTYQACDVVQSTPDVVLCDFNAGVFPSFDRRFDVIVCSGVFEYLRQPQSFLDRIQQFGDAVLLSYHPFASGDSKWKRLAWNWVNHFSESELHRLFADAGLEWTIAHGAGTPEHIYALRRAV